MGRLVAPSGRTFDVSPTGKEIEIAGTGATMDVGDLLWLAGYFTRAALMCANCRKPLGDHCKRHEVPCCPGRCPPF